LLKTGQTTQYDGELDDGYYEMGVAKSYTINTIGAQSGTTNVDLTHLVSDTGAFTSADKTYTDTGKCGVFKVAGGETIVISGSGSNNGVFTTVSATADKVVFAETITDEVDAPLTTFKKREAISNNTVLDNNTGLTWLRSYSKKMGVAGDGQMPWSGKDYDIFQFCAAANAASLGGHNDWRIPNIFETISLANASGGHWYPDSTAFPEMQLNGKYVWTSTEVYNNNRVYFRGYYVGGFYSGGASASTAYLVFLVRGGTA